MVTEHEQCQWFLMCDNEADREIVHPVLGAVPSCKRCADKYLALGGNILDVLSRKN